jgi:hypothetical protein
VKAKKKFAERFVGITPRDFGELEDRQRKVLEIFLATSLREFSMSAAVTGILQ